MAAVMIWGARLAWLAVALVGGSAIGSAVDARSGPVQFVAVVGCWCAWALGALALALPSVVTLTVLRAVVPTSLAATIVIVASGAGADDALLLGLPAVVATLLVVSADVGRPYLQASAYGDEARFGLRPPLGYLAACVVTWLIWVAAVIAAPLALAAEAWAVGVLAAVVVAVGAATLPRRWHQLSRRWLVLVPAGVVVHDPVVLDETLMVSRRRIRTVAVNELGHGARGDILDLTGPTPGLAVELVVDGSVTATLARRPHEPRGRALSAAALLVSPTRPGALLSEARRRRLPVD